MSGRTAAEPQFFATPDALRAWLRQHHDSATELWVGLYRRDSGRPSITWPELVDQLLCFGWIDGVRKSHSAVSYVIRVTPRRPGSSWSAVNLVRVRALLDAGLMEPAGRAACDARDETKTNRYSFERAEVELGAEYEAEFRRRRRAWAFFESQPPGYRRTATWWVVSAKKEETRRRRLETLIRDSGNGERIALLRR